MTTSNFPPEDCRLTHDITPEARQYAYIRIYRAQMDHGDKLPWEQERDLFHLAIHEYESLHPGKI
jgi:hypothetical protein